MKAAYIVIDMINDLVNADGFNGKTPMGAEVQSREVVKKTAKAIDKARAAGAVIGFVRVGFSPDYRECSTVSPLFQINRKNGIMKIGTWGDELHPDLPWKPEDLQVIKHRVSPWYSTTLEAQLKAQGITRIYTSGVSTQAAVQCMIREGHDRDYEMVLVEDCCAAVPLQEHLNSVQSLSRFCTVTTSDATDFK